MNNSWFVYICQARTGRYYVGISTNPEMRLKKHNTSEGAKLAKYQGPFELIYVSPPYSNKSAARKREMQLKGWSRIKKEKLISGDWS